jgi:ABC-type multidrug transport system, ATPase component
MSDKHTPNQEENLSEPTTTTTRNNALPRGISSSNIPLVKLNLNNITYRPLMKDFSASPRLNLSIRSKKKSDDLEQMKPLLSRKTVLKNVTPPAIQPYRLSAWMGPSGSGKTSLLSIAAGMTDFDPGAFGEDSQITINDDAHNLLSKKGAFPKGLSGIVWQDDLLLSNLTVRETVEFAATLKTPRSEIHRVKSMVDQVLEDLGLGSVQHSMIGQSLGGPGRGISGGERKRVSIAQELVTKPPLIFLDEPTSGLDSSAALELMKILKRLCLHGGHSIVTVIHQPRTTIFDLVDDLLLLSRGEEVYSGPALGARQVLESCPIIGFKLPEQTNIADWIMDLIIMDENRSKNHSSQDDEEDPLVNQRLLPQHWRKIKGGYQKDENRETKSSQLKYSLSSLAEIQNSIPKYTASFATQLRLLTRRAIKQTRGEKISNASIIAMIAFVIFESAFWFRLKNDTDQIYKRNSLVFFMIIAQANGVVISSVPTFRRDRALLTRERAKKMYRVLPYFLAKTLAGALFYLIYDFSQSVYC